MNHTYRKPELALRLLYFIVSSAITASGAGIFVLSVTGTDPFGVLMQGIARLLGISNGIAHIAINVTYLLIILLIDRSYIRIGTFVALFATGPVIDIVMGLLGGVITEALPYPVRFCIMLFACCLLGFGLSGIMSADVGVGANDLVAIIISDKLHIQFRWIRIAVDAASVLAGFLLGGIIGAGTIVCVLLTGPITQFFIPFSGRTLLLLVRKLVPEEL